MGLMPDISFVIPVYNVSGYLREFFEPFKFCNLSSEIIFVNDGSTDSSGDVLEHLATLDSRVIILQKENGGVSSARNHGIRNASGKYISCLDPDDLLSPCFFEYLAYSIKTFKDIDTIIYGYEKFQDGEQPNIFNSALNPAFFEIVPKKRLSALHNYPWLRVVRREFYNDNFFPEGIIYEDSVTVPLLNAQAKNVLKIDRALYYYRVRKDSLTNFNIQKNMDMIKALSLLESKVEKCPKYSGDLYACVAHLSRSALITLYKLSYRENDSLSEFKDDRELILSNFCRYSLMKILQSDASPPDKICFILLKMRAVGFVVFKILYKIISK